MNVFYLDKNPYKAAEFHGDKHVQKMILETAQLLSTAHHVLSGETNEKGKPFSQKCLDNGLYKPSHINHPCAIWVRENFANYDWAYRLLEGLCEEFWFRRAKDHATKRLLDPLAKKPELDYAVYYTDPPLVMPDEFKTDNPVESYRNYYKYKYVQGIVSYNWAQLRKEPEWLLAA